MVLTEIQRSLIIAAFGTSCLHQLACKSVAQNLQPLQITICAYYDHDDIFVQLV